MDNLQYIRSLKNQTPNLNFVSAKAKRQNMLESGPPISRLFASTVDLIAIEHV
jgi:hypothetical protein